MASKTDILRPRVIECVEHLRKLIDLDAPAVIIGAEAWHVFTTVLAAYGVVAGSTMIGNLRDGNLHGRGVCTYDGCTSYINRPGMSICAGCAHSLGIDDDLAALAKEPPDADRK